MTVELGSATLTHLTHIEVRERARLVRHPVPGFQGDFAQAMGRPSVEVAFRGLFYGPEAATTLGDLRAAYLESQPLDFFTEAVGEGYFTQVLITRLEVWQRAGWLDQFDYWCEVVEYIEPPEPAVADPFAALDAGLLDEATAFMDDVQNALEEVSGLVDLIANFPSFGDPTTQLGGMLEQFEGLTGGGLSSLTAIRDLF